MIRRDFFLNAKDILYFTSMVEDFDKFCTDNGLQMITNEVDVPRRAEDEGVKEDDAGSEGVEVYRYTTSRLVV